MKDINLIKPKIYDKSDKYSWNLFRFFEKHGGGVQVYQTEDSLILAKENSQCKCCTNVLVGASIKDVRWGDFDIATRTLSTPYYNVTEDFIENYIQYGIVFLDSYVETLKSQMGALH